MVYASVAVSMVGQGRSFGWKLDKINKDPCLIAGYFVNAVSELKCVPMVSKLIRKFLSILTY